MPVPSDDSGAPTGRREGGSGRGDKIPLCNTLAEVHTQLCARARLTALVPQTPLVNDKKRVWGLTQAAHPEFLFFLSRTQDPQDSQNALLPIEFVLQDEADQFIYRATFQVPLAKGGIVRLAVPQTSRPLEFGKRYTWTLYTHLSPNEPNFVQGTIYRRQLSAADQQFLLSATPSQRLDLYMQQGLWFDAIATLADLKQGDSQFGSTWTRLLEQIDLAELATAAFMPCCSAPQVSSALPSGPKTNSP
ncbi:MAG: DUF928 domain-containing protein [Acaryochloridaceae cyanobacterium SU_2_1]|nr:DUF928 domain-containing protein [Acaryochloridaceae cyanobacterium SU_2_1]